MFGAPFRSRRPILLILVFGVFLMVVGLTALSQAIIVTTRTSQTMLDAVVGSDAATVRGFANAYLTTTDLDGASLSPARLATLEPQVAALVESGEVVRLEVRLPDGTVLLSSAQEAIGAHADATPQFQAAVDGTVTADFAKVATAETTGPAVGAQDLMRAYFPLKAGGQVRAVVGVWRDAAPILFQLDELRREIVLVTLFAGLVAGIALFLVFRSAQGRITRQTDQLLEATRRDQLTGTLNHGALVGTLALAIEAARQADETLGIALVDIDNFRNLNETHGHEAGDQALLAVAGMLRRLLAPDVRWGRYGPDEFLVIVRAAQTAELEPTIEAVRAKLADLSLRFDGSERLPLTISAGVCTFPLNGEAVTTLLSTASLTLDEARASGGDGVRVAQADREPEAAAVRFDILEGLVIAVDTKDHYTRRHSEDVARYAGFLADRLGLEPGTQQVLHRAGRLHDIGKIGIPDQILRRPGALTDGERAIVQQHVALGDLIVRDLPDIDQIRAGIRHHHERWDGTGYLDHLAGEEIPLVARILAVCDAFSAMTTTRPYRKALSVEEALSRLEDAAGTQLDEALVTAFTQGIRTAAAPPLPGDGKAGLWTPAGAVVRGSPAVEPAGSADREVA